MILLLYLLLYLYIMIQIVYVIKLDNIDDPLSQQWKVASIAGKIVVAILYAFFSPAYIIITLIDGIACIYDKIYSALFPRTVKSKQTKFIPYPNDEAIKKIEKKGIKYVVARSKNKNEKNIIKFSNDYDYELAIKIVKKIDKKHTCHNKSKTK